ncbi:rhamnogalacturonan acetylesterase [Flavobacterium sp. Sd200]|uniref:rhamnogalacturonan acetylesterase n=1 Tax=Flavobacterium sp. Sd200 TaxID=2692211 RepID=UPI00136D2D29|nr:rhamnogalacturonan acetylesterase [Flavobacterium sp. Sd200]MXN90844.1 rhamnogalacturonan acetylesterase [Flavobacterium sp. Sd200]
MKKIILLVVLSLTSLAGTAQQSSYKFDFGQGKAAKGYIKITPESAYSDKTGYGFEAGSKVQSFNSGGKGAAADYITAKEPFFFSVKLPEGNYDVKLLLGDTKGTSATTVRVESRRLMLENIKTKKGETAEKLFTVHIRDSIIRDNNGNVVSKTKIKPRERQNKHWDDLLTIEFNDSLPKICAVEIIPNKTATTIFLAGDSTVTDQPEDPWASWGQMFPVFLVPGKVAVANYAESGETLKAFERENRFAKIWSMAKPGDYLFIEFTHNDQKPGGNHLDPFTTYKETVKQQIAEAKKRGMIPVLVTSTQRRKFGADGKIENTLLEYPEALRQTAKEENVALIDLSAMSKTLYETLGEEGSKNALVHYPANTYPNQTKALEDNTHFNMYGAYELSKCVVSSIRKQNLSLSKFIQTGVIDYSPEKPTPFKSFYWPASKAGITKPDGN